MLGRARDGHRSRRTGPAAGIVLVLALGLAGCGDGDGDAALRAAEVNVTAKQEALDSAEEAAAEATSALCEAGASYITAIDRYGDLLVQTAPTVGDVITAGEDLQAPRDEVVEAAEAAEAAQAEVVSAQDDLTEAEAALASLQGSTPADEAPEPEEPQVSASSIDRVKQAESDFATVREGIDEDTPLSEASQQFNSAVVALEMAWLGLFAESGCLSDEDQEQAQAAVAGYTSALQEALAEAGYYDGEIDGVYGPETVDAIQALQEAAGLPTTGAMDKATIAALEAELASEGSAQAQSAIAATAAVQQTLTLLGYWDGPVDGEWTDELTDAVKELQEDLGVEPTGEVDAETIEAFQEALEQLTATPTPSPSTSETPASASPAPSASAS